MPQIFQEETLSMVWDMITVENMKMRKVSEILCCTYDKVNQMYQAAYRRWGNNQHTNRKRTISVRKSLTQKNQRESGHLQCTVTNLTSTKTYKKQDL